MERRKNQSSFSISYCCTKSRCDVRRSKVEVILRRRYPRKERTSGEPVSTNESISVLIYVFFRSR